MNNSISEIQQLIQHYFDGLYRCDVALLSQIFHPDARYVTATETPPLILSVPEYFKIVEQRTSPESLGQERQDQITSIQILSETTAVVTLECVIAPRYFYDVLTLIYMDRQWWIISKVFHYKIFNEQIQTHFQ